MSKADKIVAALLAAVSLTVTMAGLGMLPVQPVWAWLVANGLVHDLVSACVLVPVMHVMAGRPLRRLARAAEDVRAKIESLDREVKRND